MTLVTNYLKFPETPLLITNNTTPEQFYDKYLFGMNHHITVKDRQEIYYGPLGK